ncbi:hypothetical protein GF406_10240 [candidate division KSB1 bacterium]|nr:hypothetical protein [candidate division KSB1 bacterium]
MKICARWTLLFLFYFSTVFGQFIVKEGTNEYLKVDKQTGNVAIGNITPSAKLDVLGSIRFRSLTKGTLTHPVLTVDSQGNLSVVEDAQGSGADGVVTGVSVSGTQSKTITLTRSIGANLTETFTDAIEDDQPLSEVLTDGNNANSQSAINFSNIAVGTTTSNAKLRVMGHETGTLPIFTKNYNFGIYATDYASSDNENQTVIEGIGTVMTVDNDKSHIGVQGILVGGSSHDEWIASASLGYHNTNTGNYISGVSSQVQPLSGKSYLATGLETALFRGENHNTGEKDYGLYVEAHKNYLAGDVLLGGRLGINIGDREPKTWFEINGQPYISAGNAGIIMKSDDTTCWQVRVDGSGQLFTTSVTCP